MRGLAQRAFVLNQKYGLSLEQYDAMLSEQNGVCAICEQPEVRRSRNGNLHALSVDHDHSCCPGKMTCGKCIRGLLCRKCNYGISVFDENTESLRKAADYLSARKERSMHAQEGTVGSPEFNGTEAHFKVTLRFPEAAGIKVEDRAAFAVAMSSDLADILTEEFARALITEARPEIGVRVL